MVENAGQLVDDGLVGCHFAIEHAQRIGRRTPLAIAAQARRHRFERGTQPLDVLRPAIVVAHRVDQQLETAEPGPPEDLDHHLDHFRVHRGRFRADGFRADLIELPVAARLRSLAPEHGADVVELLHPRPLIQPVLDVSANHRGRVFRPQRQRGSVAIVESVHLLVDDIGVGAHAAREQLGLFEDRRADLAVVVSAEHGSGLALHGIPVFREWGQ